MADQPKRRKPYDGPFKEVVNAIAASVHAARVNDQRYAEKHRCPTCGSWPIQRPKGTT